MTYTKETAFIIFTVIAITELVFDKLSKAEKILNYALLVNSGVFVGIYIYRKMTIVTTRVYASIVSCVNEIGWDFFIQEPIMILVILLGSSRAYRVIFCRDRRTIFWDAVLFAAVVHACAFPIMKLTGCYYGFPSVVLFVPAFAVFVSRSLWSLTIPLILSLHAIPIQISDIAYTIAHREHDMELWKIIRSSLQQGGRIYWLTDSKNINNKYDNLWRERTQQFTEYYIHSAFDIDRISVLPDINGNDVVLCNEMLSPLQAEQLQLRNFVKLTTVQDVGVYKAREKINTDD